MFYPWFDCCLIKKLDWIIVNKEIGYIVNKEIGYIVNKEIGYIVNKEIGKKQFVGIFEIYLIKRIPYSICYFS